MRTFLLCLVLLCVVTVTSLKMDKEAILSRNPYSNIPVDLANGGRNLSSLESLDAEKSCLVLF